MIGAEPGRPSQANPGMVVVYILFNTILPAIRGSEVQRGRKAVPGILGSGHPRREDPRGCACWGRPDGTQQDGGDQGYAEEVAWSRDVARGSGAEAESGRGNKLCDDNYPLTPHGRKLLPVPLPCRVGPSPRPSSERRAAFAPRALAEVSGHLQGGSLLLRAPGAPPAPTRASRALVGALRPLGGTPSILHRLVPRRQRLPSLAWSPRLEEAVS